MMSIFPLLQCLVYNPMGLPNSFWPARGYTRGGYTRSIFIIGFVTRYAFPVVNDHIFQQKMRLQQKWGLYTRAFIHVAGYTRGITVSFTPKLTHTIYTIMLLNT